VLGQVPELYPGGCDRAERPASRRCERVLSEGVELAHPPRGVDLVVGDDERAEAARFGAASDPRGGDEVASAVGRRIAGRAHRRGEDDGLLDVDQQVAEERGFLERVRAVRVIDAFFKIKDRDSVLGTYSIDANGDTTLSSYGGNTVSGGRIVFNKVITGETHA
jgi:hypothetical protein